MMVKLVTDMDRRIPARQRESEEREERQSPEGKHISREECV